MSSADMTPESLPSADPAGDGGDTLETSTPAADAPSDDAIPAPRRRRRRLWFWGIGAALLTAVVLGAAFVPTPYVLVQPGSVRAAEPKVQVEGAQSYDSDGAVLFTTVYVDDATVFGLVRGALDDAIEVRDSEEVYGDRGRDETRRINQQEMDFSKLVAELEALSYLGYDAEFAADGVRVVDVAEDAPSAEVLVAGDVITSVDGAPVSLPGELRDALAGKAPGDTVSLGVQRSQLGSGESATGSPDELKSLTVEAELTAPDAGTGGDESQAVLGVVVEPFNPQIDSDVAVSIDSGQVTGPSAGLAWSLAIIDVLTPGSLTEGREVAVTGEILTDGK
ncbi:MAG: PDZ domain-containing protein [Microthrixaceae bacterium]